MQQKFLSNLILLIVLNLIVKPLSIFGIDATVQNRVGTEDYGFYFSLLNFTYLFNILLDLGINNFTTKNVAQYPGLMGKYIGKIAGLRLILFFVYVAFSFGIAISLGYSKEAYPILFILIVQQFLITMIAYFRSYLSGMLKFRWDALLSVLDRSLLIILCGSALIYTRYSNTFEIEHFVYLQFICYAISFLVGLIIVTKYVGRVSISFNKSISLLIIRESIPYALLIVLMLFYTRVDSVMLERMLPDGAEQSGIYAQGFRLIDALFMFAMLFSNLLLPIFARMFRTGDNMKDLYELSSKMLVWGAIGVAALCYFNSKELLDLIYTNNTQSSAPPFQMLILTFVAMCIILISGTFLTALGEMQSLNIIALLGLIISVSLNFYFIPKYGAYGAAITTLFTQFTVAIAQVFIAYDHLNISVKSLRYTMIFVYTGIVFAGIYFLKLYEIHLLLQVAFIAACILIFKVINIKLIKEIIVSAKNRENDQEILETQG